VNRTAQITLIVTFPLFCWLGMQIVHESGHVIAAKATGGTIVAAVLYPTAISRTEVFPNPHPLIEVWAGPVIGSVLPLIAYLIAKLLRTPGAYLVRFFAGFCLAANGSYVLAGAIARMGDPGDLLRYGAARWQLIAFGFVTASLGLWLWNKLGPGFGLGSAKGKVSTLAALISVGLLFLTLTCELLFGHP